MTDSQGSPSSAPDWVLVTGGSRGIGRAVALDLAAAGYRVVINYRSNDAEAESAVAAIEADGGQGEALAFDVGDAAACQAAAEALLERLGPPFALVNNAGITRDGLMIWMKQDDWSDVLRTNLDSFYFVTQPFLKAMMTERRGRIVNITSTAGQAGNAGQVNYSASKSGLIGATRALAKEIAKRNITVNAVAPGFIETDMTSELPVDRLKPMIPAGRFGRAEEVSSVVRFLLTDAASYVTSQVIGVNGGLH